MAQNESAMSDEMDFSSPGRASTASMPELLTPRTKVAKMLEDIDNAPTPSQGLANSSSIPTGSAEPNALDQTISASVDGKDRTKIGALFQSDDESDDEVRRPVGRVARRMQFRARNATDLASHSAGAVTSSPEHAINDLDRNAAVDSDQDDLYSVTPNKGSRSSNTLLSPLPQANESSDLFVSPAKTIDDNSADELPDLPSLSKGRLADLVAQKRAERLARESKQAERQEGTHSPEKTSMNLPEDIIEDPQHQQNAEIDRIMSDAAKPTRKASKKAILEMERETQRLARQQALAHQMKVKKKFTTSGLFARFNYRPVGEQEAAPPIDGDLTASSVPNSDGSEHVPREPVSTPPSSPPTPLDRQRALVEKGALSKLVLAREDSLASLADCDEEELPDISTVLSQAEAHQKTIAEDNEPKRGLKLARLGKKAMLSAQLGDSDDELEILPAAVEDVSIFDKAKKAFKGGNADSHAIHNLKHLAHIGADVAQPRRGKKLGFRPSLNPAVLEAQLRLRAKEQARAQQLERIAELQAKGINVQTSEEREREAEDFENLLEKARQEAAALRQAEKAAAQEGGEAHAHVSDDESEDEDYEDSGSESDDLNKLHSRANDLIEDAAEETDEEGSGSEDIDEDGGDMEQEVDQERSALNPERQPDGPKDPSINDKETGIATREDGEHAEPEGSASQPLLRARKPRKSRIVLDDDSSDEEPVQLTPAGEQYSTQSGEPDPFAAFNFGMGKNSNAFMSPTQAFNATMQTPTQLTQQDSMDILQQLVPPLISSVPSLPMNFGGNQGEDGGEDYGISSSQVPDSQKVNLLWESQPPETPVPALKRHSSAIEMETPGWEPSQDIGLPSSWQAGNALQREGTAVSVNEHETQSTVRLRISQSPAPDAAALRRKRFVQRQGAIIDSSDEEDSANPESNQPNEKNAFREMARKRKEALSAAEIAEAQKEMKGMMDEQAEESEDEYAGLGGDDYIAPETEQDRAMIDSSQIDVDEQALAAHFAERQRIADEAEASKLYKDLMTGALRRKQANMFDLDEDEDDLAVRRRQMRQLEEARKRKLLLQDDNIAGLAGGKLSKGKDAFLKAIADDDDGDDDFLEIVNPEDEASVSQTQTDSQPSQESSGQATPLTEVSGNKRRLDEGTDERPAAKHRRTQASAFRAPASLLEVRESVSFLLDEVDQLKFGPSVLEASLEPEHNDGASEEEEGDEDNDEGNDEGQDDTATRAEIARQNDGGYAPDQAAAQMPPPRLPASQRRTVMKATVVDRLSLKRGSSTSDGAAGRNAWGPSTSGGFKVPSLLRRAATNIAAGANERGVTTPVALSRENSGVKMGGTKKSSLAYQARAEERKAQVEASVRRRAENTARIAQLRRGNSSSLGTGLAGRFE